MEQLPTSPNGFFIYFKDIVSATSRICKEYWLAVAIAWVLAPIADVLIYYNYGRAKASEWTFSSIMTDKIPFTIFVLTLTLFLVIVYSPYILWRKTREQITALEQKVMNQPSLELFYDPQTCLKVTDNKYLFSVVVQSHVGAIPGVIVGLEAFTGMEGFGHLNRPFRFKHYEQNGQLTCNLGEKISVNVLFFQKPNNNSAPHEGRLQLLFQGDAISLPGKGPYTMKLRATGGGALPDYKTYRIGIREEVPFMEVIKAAS